MNKQLKYINGETDRPFLKKETYNKLVNIKMHKDNFLYYYGLYYAVRIITISNNYPTLLFFAWFN